MLCRNVGLRAECTGCKISYLIVFDNTGDASEPLNHRYVCVCINAASHHSQGYFHTSIDQLQQHPDWMIPAGVAGSARVHGRTFGPRTKTAARNKDSMALFLIGKAIDPNGKRMCESY